MIPDFSQRVRLYLKPKGHNTTCTFLFVLIDFALCWLFLILQALWALEGDFPSINEQVMVYLICYGLVLCILAYCLIDGLRFLSSWKDKFLYVVSCILQKPILLPILAPGACFTSPIANKKFGNQVRFMVDGMEQTNFMMAV